MRPPGSACAEARRTNVGVGWHHPLMVDATSTRSLRDGSHVRVGVRCDARASSTCRDTWTQEWRVVLRFRANNNGQDVCLQCSQRLKNRGRANPNAKYMSLRDDCFSSIVTDDAAYVLGLIASDGAISRGSISVYLKKSDRALVERVAAWFSPEIPVRRKGDLVGLTINSQRIVEDVCRHLEVVPGKKSRTVGFPSLVEERLRWAFVRGLFDGDGYVRDPSKAKVGYPRCGISSTSPRLLAGLSEFSPFPHSVLAGGVEWNGYSAIDFLGRIYDGASMYLSRKRDLYLDWCAWVPSLAGARNTGGVAHFRWVRSDPAAIPPSKERASDSGYDLTLIRRAKVMGQVEFFDTGIKVQPSFGWYFDLIARSSIVKTGYLLANSLGVIDRSYVGPVLVPLVRVDPAAPDLELPARLVQLVPRPIVHMQMVEVDQFEPTGRGEGGFGSSGEPFTPARRGGGGQV